MIDTPQGEISNSNKPQPAKNNPNDPPATTQAVPVTAVADRAEPLQNGKAPDTPIQPAAQTSVKPKATADSCKSQTNSKNPSPSVRFAPPSSVITDPVEAAAAAYNQPMQYIQSNQFMPSGVQHVHIPPMVGGVSPGSLYVGELDEEVTEGQLYEIFSTFGSVHNIRVCKDVRTRRSLGYAYVNFLNTEDASRALHALNYQLLKDRPMRIMWIQRNPEVRKFGSGNVYIKNLDPSIDTKSLHDTFKVFGKIMSCKVACDESGSKGHGYIHFENPDDATHAIAKVNGMLLNDRKVYVGHHIQKKDRLSKQEELKKIYTNIYVKNLPDDADEEKLRAMFEKFGGITSAVISYGSNGKSRGFGFVCFGNHDAASRAVDEMHNKVIDGKTLYVKRAQKKAEREVKLKEQYEKFKEEKLKKYKNINLYIKNLDDSITDKQLHQEFSDFGVITSAKVMRDEKTGNSKGFGFVCFSSPEEATKAVTEMNGRILVSKPIYVALAQRKDTRRAQLSMQMQKNWARAQQVPHISDIYQPPPMIYHPQGFAYQPQNGAPYFAAGGLMRQRWVPPHQQIHSASPIPGPVYLAPMRSQVASQQRSQRQVHPQQHRLPLATSAPGSGPGTPAPVAPQQMVPGGVSLPNPSTSISSRKASQPQTSPFNYQTTSPTTQPATSTSIPPNTNPDIRYAPPKVQQQQVLFPLPIHPEGAAPNAPTPFQVPPPLGTLPVFPNPYLLSNISPDVQKRTLGEALFSAVHHLTPKYDGKVTGMLLELGNDEIISILKDPVALKAKVQEALQALEDYNKSQHKKLQKQKDKPSSQQPQPANVKSQANNTNNRPSANSDTQQKPLTLSNTTPQSAAAPQQPVNSTHQQQTPKPQQPQSSTQSHQHRQRPSSRTSTQQQPVVATNTSTSVGGLEATEASA